MKNAILVDLDGTLSNCEWRLPFIQNKPKLWGRFFRGIPQDEIIVPVKDFIAKFSEENNAEIVFLTARPDNTVNDTVQWLLRHGYESLELYMRKHGDYRVDVVVKEELYLNEIKSEYNVLLVLDDKKEIRDMFESHGIKTIDPVTL